MNSKLIIKNKNKSIIKGNKITIKGNKMLRIYKKYHQLFYKADL